MDRVEVSYKNLARMGALIAIAIVLVYSLLIMIYTIVRSSLTIYRIMPGNERNSILIVSGISVAWSVAIFSMLMALISSVIGGLMALLLKKSFLHLNPLFSDKKAIWISALLALALLCTLCILSYSRLGEGFLYPETFLFWFLFPGVIYFTACIAGGRKINKALYSAAACHLINAKR